MFAARETITPRSPFWAAVRWATAAAVLVLSWQWTTVQANYRGNWTGLFCTGGERDVPVLDAPQPTWIFPGSQGYDGQFYRYIAYDPLMRTGLRAYVDDPRIRYGRVLVSAIAHLAALGNSRWIDAALIGTLALSAALGVYWSSQLAQAQGLASAWGLLFLALPAAIVSIDRMVVDGTLAACAAGTLWLARRNSWAAVFPLAAAALTRETGFVLIAAYLLRTLLGRNWRRLPVAMAAALPGVAWYVFVAARTTAIDYGYRTFRWSDWGDVWPSYSPGTPAIGLLRSLDFLAPAGIVLLLALAMTEAVRLLWALKAGLRNPGSSIAILGRVSAAAFAALAIPLAIVWSDHWNHVYSFGRVHSPILVCLAAGRPARESRWALLAGALMTPRVLAQLSPQVLGIARWAFN